METANEQGWLKSVCMPEEAVVGAQFRVPFGAAAFGRTWLVAACGSGLVALERAVPLVDPAPLDVQFLLKVEGGLPVDLAALKAFVGEPWKPPAVPSCGRCSSSGYVPCRSCGGDGLHTCRDCDDEHDCGACDGEGEVACPDCKKAQLTKEPVRVGRIGCASYDLNLLGRALAGLAPQPAWLIQDPRDGQRAALTLRGSGWCVVVMPRASHADADKLPEFQVGP
jgi:hypothetical protein